MESGWNGFQPRPRRKEAGSRVSKPLGLLCPQGACFLGALSSLTYMGSLFPGVALEAWMTMRPCVLPINAKGPTAGGSSVLSAGSEDKQPRPSGALILPSCALRRGRAEARA